MEIKEFTEKEIEKLKEAKGSEEEYSFSEIVPGSWEHNKRQYVAEIVGYCKNFDGLEREFISNLEEFSEDGKRAKLFCIEPEKEKTLIEIRDGSHRNLFKKIYRKQENKWRLIALRRGMSNYYGGGNTSNWTIFD